TPFLKTPESGVRRLNILMTRVKEASTSSKKLSPMKHHQAMKNTHLGSQLIRRQSINLDHFP
ncbi:hypothetical protein Tco_0949862, partial [Tanacetum coccineum]